MTRSLTHSNRIRPNGWNMSSYDWSKDQFALPTLSNLPSRVLTLSVSSVFRLDPAGGTRRRQKRKATCPPRPPAFPLHSPSSPSVGEPVRCSPRSPSASPRWRSSGSTGTTECPRIPSRRQAPVPQPGISSPTPTFMWVAAFLLEADPADWRGPTIAGAPVATNSGVTVWVWLCECEWKWSNRRRPRVSGNAPVVALHDQLMRLLVWGKWTYLFGFRHVASVSSAIFWIICRAMHLSILLHCNKAEREGKKRSLIRN